jgi:hypothetical protein
MDSSDVDTYVEQSQSILEESPQMDEQNTKVKLVQPFISLLGWDMYSANVELEYPVQVGVGTKKVDYALMVENSPRVFIEAKGCDTTITDSEVDQLRSYMRQELEVKWGILTNGEEFEIFRKSTSDGTDGELSLGRFSLADLQKNPEILEIISKEAIMSGESDDWVRRIEETRAAIDHLQDHKGRVANEVADVVTDEVGEVSTLQLETESKEFVDTLIRSLEAEADLIAQQGGSGGGGGGGGDGTGGGDGWEPEVGANAVAGKISRAELDGPTDASVVVVPSQESGLAFLKENNAWGFVRMGQTPDYAAVYVTRTAREVRYVAEVKEIVGSEEAGLAKPLDEYTGDEAEFDTDKKVVVFKPGTLYELEDPIPFGEEYPQSHRYTELGKLKEATVTDDLFN